MRVPELRRHMMCDRHEQSLRLLVVLGVGR